MTLQQLRYVVEVARSGSMNEAAKRLFVSQPSLSNGIRELEKELDLVIFDRNNKGVSVSVQGKEFLGYAKQILEQTNLLEERYHTKGKKKERFAVSSQHYDFVVDAFIKLVKKYGFDEYELAISETTTYRIIEDVSEMRSELGILYLNDFNRKVIERLLKENNLDFSTLFEATPHVFMCNTHPLADKKRIQIEELDDFPCLFFDQGEYNSFHFSEEILSTLTHKKEVKVTDRATLFNLLLGIDGYTISTGLLNSNLNSDRIISVVLDSEEKIEVGVISQKNLSLSHIAKDYMKELEEIIYRFKL